MTKAFKPQKLKGSMKSMPSKGDRQAIFVDYGGAELRKILDAKPVAISDCDLKKAKAGDTNQKICMAQAYLSSKDCKNAKIWALEVFEKDKWNEYNEPVLDLLGRLETHGECIEFRNDL